VTGLLSFREAPIIPFIVSIVLVVICLRRPCTSRTKRVPVPPSHLHPLLLKSYPSPNSQHYVNFPREPDAVILFQLPNNLQRRCESLRETDEERSPLASPRITASGVRLPCIDPRRTSRSSRRLGSSSEMRREIDEMAQPYG
jgi:hypothetical protein